MLKCKCGKFFPEKEDGRQFQERFCSNKCNRKYGQFSSHSWLFNRNDLRQSMNKSRCLRK